MNLILAILTVIFGLAFGSFFNVCIHRLPRKESIIFPNSHCPYCRKPIKAFHNIPVFSYLWLRGKCAGCGSPIHWHYFLVELLTPLLFLLVFVKFGFSILLFKYLIFISFGIIICFIDAFHKIIPDVLTLPFFVLGLAFSFVPGTDINLLSALAGAGFGFLVFLITAYFFLIATHRESLGGGDIKLIAGVGSFIGIIGTIFTVICGSLIALIVIIASGYDRRQEFPFGPFLVIGAASYILFGSSLFRYYIDYFAAF